jgi:hypothetical protein
MPHARDRDAARREAVVSTLLWTLAFLFDGDEPVVKVARRVSLLALLASAILLGAGDAIERGNWMAQAGLALEVRP